MSRQPSYLAVQDWPGWACLQLVWSELCLSASYSGLVCRPCTRINLDMPCGKHLRIFWMPAACPIGSSCSVPPNSCSEIVHTRQELSAWQVAPLPNQDSHKHHLRKHVFVCFQLPRAYPSMVSPAKTAMCWLKTQYSGNTWTGSDMLPNNPLQNYGSLHAMLRRMHGCTMQDVFSCNNGKLLARDVNSTIFQRFEKATTHVGTLFSQEWHHIFPEMPEPRARLQPELAGFEVEHI